MDGKYDVHGIKEFMDFGFAVGKAVEQAKADGKIDANDTAYFMPVFVAAVPAMKDLGEDVNEIKEVSPDEAKELLSYGVQKLPDVVTDKVKAAKAGAAFKFALAMAQFAKDWSDASKVV